MADILEQHARDFKDAAAPLGKTSVEIDDDLANWLKAEYREDWKTQVNELVRFFVETSQGQTADFEGHAAAAGLKF